MKVVQGVKPEIRVVGISRCRPEGEIIGIVYRGAKLLDGAIRIDIKEGEDLVEIIAKALLRSPYYEELRVVILDGASFPEIDAFGAKRLAEEVKLPIIVFHEAKPSLVTGKLFRHQILGREVYFQLAGLTPTKARQVLNRATASRLVPEALAVARIVAKELSRLARRSS